MNGFNRHGRVMSHCISHSCCPFLFPWCPCRVWFGVCRMFYKQFHLETVINRRQWQTIDLIIIHLTKQYNYLHIWCVLTLLWWVSVYCNAIFFENVSMGQQSMGLQYTGADNRWAESKQGGCNSTYVVIYFCNFYNFRNLKT